MEPIAVGFMVLVGTAALLGVVVGAIGGAVAWRVRICLPLGGLPTGGALFVVLVAEQNGRAFEFGVVRAQSAGTASGDVGYGRLLDLS
jgi:hypothetical protein